MLYPWAATVLALLSIPNSALAGDSEWQSPIYKNLYSVALPVPEVKVPVKYVPPPMQPRYQADSFQILRLRRCSNNRLL